MPTRYGDAIGKLMVGMQRVCTGTTCDYSMRYVNLYSSCSINIVSQTVSGNFSSQHNYTDLIYKYYNRYRRILLIQNRTSYICVTCLYPLPHCQYYLILCCVHLLQILSTQSINSSTSSFISLLCPSDSSMPPVHLFLCLGHEQSRV